MPPHRIVLAEYFTTDDVTLLFGVRADWNEPEVVEIKQPLSQIRSYVTENFGAEEDKEGSKSQTTSEKVRKLNLGEWQERFVPFIEPILKWAEPGDYLYLVPHDVMHYLPLHTIQVEGGYLIERNPVLYTPSASVLKYCQAKRKGRREKALVFGDSSAERPLPNSRQEAFEVANLFGTQPFVGLEAKKSLLKQKLEQEREEIDILHFACHGYFHPHQALKSGILMAPDSEENEAGEVETSLHGLPISRYLTAEEFFGIEMHADLVTLSACESGVNQIRPGDELFGFMRALIYSGTPSVVMSLWGVNDISTELLMASFYRYIKNGDTKVEALQKAQLDIKNMTAAQAEGHYDDILSKSKNLEPGHPYRLRAEMNIKSIKRKLLAAEAEEGHPVSMNYPIFKHPYFWAPFILVGDWK